METEAVTEEKESNSSTQKLSFYDKIKKYVEIIQSDEFAKAFSMSAGTLAKLFKHILPRKWQIDASVSLADPSTTAKILEVTSMIYPWTYKHIHVTTDFSDEHIDADGYARGHITVGKIVWLAAVVYFNKNVKKIIKLFKEV